MDCLLDEEMPRRNRTFKLDERVLEALEVLAQKNNASVNRYLENLLFSHAKKEGEIPIDAMPLGDSRGGKREGAGRKSNQDADDRADSNE